LGHFGAMEATTRRLPPILQIEAKAKISALLSDLEMKAYLSNENNNIATPLQSTVHRVNNENLIASLTTENPRSGHEEIIEDKSYYNL